MNNHTWWYIARSGRIIAWVLFMVVKALNRMKKAEPAAAPAAPPAQEVLLGEIRDLLKKK